MARLGLFSMSLRCGRCRSSRNSGFQFFAASQDFGFAFSIDGQLVDLTGTLWRGNAQAGGTGLGQKCTPFEPVSGRDYCPHPAGRGVRVGPLFWAGRFSVGRWREGQRKPEILNFWKTARVGVDASGPAGVCGKFFGCAGCGGRVRWW